MSKTLLGAVKNSAKYKLPFFMHCLMFTPWPNLILSSSYYYTYNLLYSDNEILLFMAYIVYDEIWCKFIVDIIKNISSLTSHIYFSSTFIND